MAAVRVMLIGWVVAGAAITCLAQGTDSRNSGSAQTNSAAPTTIQTNSASEPVLSSRPSPLITAPAFDFKPAEQPSEIAVGKKWRLGGPLVSIFKPGNLRQAPGKFLRLINPFHRSSDEVLTTPAAEYEGYQGISSRAWATTVGWHPTRSGISDPVTHEGGIGLLNFGRTGD